MGGRRRQRRSDLDRAVFAFPLTQAPKRRSVDPATATTANCPGITGAGGQNPAAAAGYLCLYVTSKANVAVGGGPCPASL